VRFFQFEVGSGHSFVGCRARFHKHLVLPEALFDHGFGLDDEVDLELGVSFGGNAHGLGGLCPLPE